MSTPYFVEMKINNSVYFKKNYCSPNPPTSRSASFDYKLVVVKLIIYNNYEKENDRNLLLIIKF